jgi:hypothetical protein
MSYIIKLRRGPAAEWTADNPVLRQGEPGVELFTGKFKLGDGIQHWNDLPYFLPEDDIIEIVDDAIAALVLATGLTINDLSTTSTTETYSVAKIKALNDAQDVVIGGKAATVHTHTMSQITDAATKAEDSVVVKLTGVQTIAGVKTFSSAPVVPDSAFSIAKTSGLQAALDAKAVIADGSATNATTTTYSANKINIAIAAAIAALVGTAPSVLDTLGEISDALNDDANAVDAIVTALAGKQPLDLDLTTIAGLTATTDSFLQAKAGAWAARTIAQVKADLGLTGINSGDQTSIDGISGTKAQFNTAVTDGDILYVGDVTAYTDEAAQDAVGTILTDTGTIDLVYNDATPSITADVKDGSVTYAKMQDVAATSRVLGRKTAGSGDVEELTPEDIRTIINIDADLEPFGFMFGGDPTGVADSTSEMQDAIDNHEVILLPSGTYKLGQIAHTGSSRTIRALGPVTIIQTDPDGVFDFKGGWDLLGTVNSIAISAVSLTDAGEGSANSNVSVLTMASSVSVTKGDILKVISDDINPYGRASLVPKMAEFSLAGITSSGTTVTLTNVLIEPYATNIRLVRPQNITFCIEGDITFDTDPAIRDTIVFGAVVGLRSAKWCHVGNGVKFYNSLGRAINNTSYRSTFDGIIFRNLANRPGKSHYGYGVQDGGWQTIMRDCHGENLRHMYSEGNGTVDHTSTEYDRYGGGWYAQVSNCTGMNCQGQVFDTHGTAYGSTFSDCHAVGSFVGASSGGSGFAARGRNITFRDCTADACMVGFALYGTAARAENCVARRTYYQSLQIAGDTSDATGITTITGITVEGGLYENLSGFECASIGTDGFNITARVNRVRVRMLGTGSGARGFILSGTGTLRVDMKDVIVDFEGFTGTGASVGILISKDTVTLRCNGLVFRGGASSYTGATIIGSSGASAGNGADVEVLEVEYEHASVSPTAIATSITKRRISYRNKFGASWFHDLVSRHLNITAAASVALTTIATLADPVIVVRFTGSAGDVTTGNLPTFSDGLRQGQIIHFVNNSNGVVTLPSTNTNPVAATAIPINGFVSFQYGGDSWRRISAPSLDVQPLDSDLTTIAGLTPTTDNFLQAKSSAWASRTIAQVKTDLGLTGTNSGDQTSIVGISGTKAQFNTAVTDGDILYVGDVTAYTDEAAQDAVGTILTDTNTLDLTYTDATPELKGDVRTQMSITSDASGLKLSGDSGTPGLAKLYGTDASGVKGWYDQPGGGSGVTDGDKGDIVISSSGNVYTIDGGVVTYAKMQDVSSSDKVLGRITAGSGDVEELTAADIRTIIGLQTDLDAKQPLDSDLTTIAGLTATTDSFLQAKAGAWAARTIAQVKTDLGLTGTNSGDQTSIVGITGTKAQFNTAVSDGDILYVGDITSFSDEAAQDAVGTILTDTATIDLTYTDGTPSITADVKDGSITYAKMQDISATSRVLGRITAGAGDPEELTGANLRTIEGTATTDTPQFAGVEVGHASDTTLARSSAGVLSVEGVVIPTVSSTSTLTNKTLTSPVINTPTGIVKGDVGLGNVDNTSNATERAATATLTNKRVTPRTGTTTSSATPTINTDNVDFYSITAQTEAITSFTTNLSGTPTDGQKLWIAITGTAARAITWGASFEASTVALPTTTVSTNRLDVGFVWNPVTSKWRCVAVA